MGQVWVVVHRRLGLVLLVLCSALVCRPLRAQPDAGTGNDDARSPSSTGDAGNGVLSEDAAAPSATDPASRPTTGLVPPSVLSQVDPVYPVQEVASGLTPSVTLSVSIDAQGTVTDAVVGTSAGAAFDEAAQAAVLQFRFRPALRDGVPIASRIPLQLSFKLPEPIASPMAPVAPADPAPLPKPVVEAPPAGPVTVQVRGTLKAEEKLTRSADAVTVVSLEQARRRSADLGEILSRVAGVTIRRYGGLGSEFRLCMNGLCDTGVRKFVDGIPIDRVYAMDVANVPVNMIDNIEIYRGVVPLRLGADALGGAINLVRPQKYETGGQASYQIGSFGQHRGTIAGRYRHEPTGFVVGLEAFADHADNDYWVDVEIPDERGRISPARVRRFHDGYSAWGTEVEVGVVERPWARKLLARAFTSTYERQHQHNIVMTVPYGDVHYGERASGGILKYENTFDHRYDVEAVATYSYRSTDFVDKGKWVYDWRGQRVRERGMPGEIEGKASDASIWQHSVFGRAMMTAKIVPGHNLQATVSPSVGFRTGDERIQLLPGARDPLTAQRELKKNVAALGYNLGLGRLRSAPEDPAMRGMEHYRFENILFGKHYLYRADSEEVLPGDMFRKRQKETNRFGVGDSLRITLIDDWLLAKTSYEYATRLPEVDEAFGNGILVHANLELNPEVSHNGNQEFQFDLRRTAVGDLWLDVNLFLRNSRDMMVLLGNDRFQSYQNVYGARSLGVENSFKWTSPGRYVTLDGSFTYTSQRNVSDQGPFSTFKGDRIPNRPYLQASWGGFLHFERVLAKDDSIEPFYQGRFVGEFFRSWESVGIREYKQVIPDQLSHTVGVTYSKTFDRYRVYGTFDVQNVTDEPLFDSFGAQRPGRAYYFKLTGDVW